MDRPTLLANVLDEIGQHNPAKAMRNMHHWPGGRVSLVHLNVLFVLDADGALPMRGLAESMDVSQASATGIVDRMEQRGLVERRRDVEDRRVVRVAVTDEGRRVIAAMGDERRDHLAQLLGELTDDELAAFLVGIRAMRRARDRWHAAAHDEPADHPAANDDPAAPAADPEPVPAPIPAPDTEGASR